MFSIGLDFGTNSVRCVIVDWINGQVSGEAISNYISGIDGVIIDEKNPHFARQNPSDWLICLEKVIKEAIKKSKKENSFSIDKIIGIGVDTTGSTPLPVDENLTPLCFYPEFQNNPNAMAYLWKDHTSINESEEITQLAKKIRPEYLKKIGGVYSSEWFFSKLLHLARVDKNVFEKMGTFIECSDFIPAVLSGIKKPEEVKRSICAAGHKAMFNEKWGGLPDNEFLEKLDISFKGLRKKLYENTYPAGKIAGYLCKDWAIKTGLKEGIPISVGGLDAHIGAVGAGIKEKILVKVIGTSGCDMMIYPKNKYLEDIPGICGIVPDSIVPGYYGIEAGQPAVGDIFYWFVKKFMPEFTENSYYYFTKKAEKIKPGESGLLCLDWQNGNRTILVDEKLTGLILGFTLNTKPEEVFRCLIEGTGFGEKVIIEQLKKYCGEVNEIIATGGISEKNLLLMQIYSDILGKEIKLPVQQQTCAVGASIFGAIAGGYFKNVNEAQEKICKFKDFVYKPENKNKKIYDRIYVCYKQLYDAFGTKNYKGTLYNVMKDLLKIKEETTGS
ncbi:MAG TPA: ribulokinase [bacterium]|nr:ribulokinase [bacterium]